MVAACRRALTQGRREIDFIRLDTGAFSLATAISIDYAVMENTRRAAVVPVAMGWSDIGSWDALWEHRRAQDGDGNSRSRAMSSPKTTRQLPICAPKQDLSRQSASRN